MKKLLFLTLIVLMPSVIWGQMSPLKAEWIERPWEYRYLLYVGDTDKWGWARDRHFEKLKKDPIKALEYGVHFAASFDPQWTLTPKVPEGESAHFFPSLHVIRLDVAQNRNIQQRPLTG